MNLFKIDFLEKLKALLKQAFTFKKYKAMTPVAAVFTGITVIPYVISTLALSAMYAITAFLFKVLSYPFDYLKDLLNGEGKEVKHATQFIIYAFSWPLIFLGYVLLAFLIVGLAVLYALISITSYIWSLGGFKFHVMITKSDDIEIEVNNKYKPATYIAYLVTFYGLLLLFLIIDLAVTLSYRGGYYGYYYPFGVTVLTPYGLPIMELFSILFIFIGFGPRPKGEISYF